MPEKTKPTRRVRRLSHALGEGVKELPTNATWLLAKAAGPLDPRSASSQGAASGLVDAARQAGVTMMDALPGGDSIELRLQRARAAVAQAQAAEDEAVQQSLEAERQADEAEQVAARCRDYVRDVEAEQDRLVEQRVEEARREARADADRAVTKAREEAEARAEEARGDAEAAHERAQVSLEAARDKLVEARSLSEEAMEATRAAAEEAHRQALQVAADAEREARTAEERVVEAERVRDSTTATASEMTRQLNGSAGLKTMTKQELLDLATAQGIEGRSAMTKGELVSALGRASRKTAGGKR
jgi:hypothetical protein